MRERLSEKLHGKGVEDDREEYEEDDVDLDYRDEFDDWEEEEIRDGEGESDSRRVDGFRSGTTLSSNSVLQEQATKGTARTSIARGERFHPAQKVAQGKNTCFKCKGEWWSV
ncbi:hypothetical protein NDU88_007444 [Pleurodeles waltl]|uniref:Uncharacterized protein n=1 Tax=Pleurodeles waltl TaxID=8319 RepID=A0AAV7NT33_PLEWA|nr:hypothetical protein NDU88_007444 [Pleurodeles waltl]